MVYSIDEVFMDVTDYLNTYKLSAHDLAMKIILDVLETTGITATAVIGTNLFPVSYTHLDVYKRQEFGAGAAWQLPWFQDGADI